MSQSDRTEAHRCPAIVIPLASAGPLAGVICVLGLLDSHGQLAHTKLPRPDRPAQPPLTSPQPSHELRSAPPPHTHARARSDTLRAPPQAP